MFLFVFESDFQFTLLAFCDVTVAENVCELAHRNAANRPGECGDGRHVRTLEAR